jgi:hypothetical protein
MKLTGVQIESFSKALMSAFPNRGELERMVLYHFGENLNTIVEASPLTYTVHKLIEWAMARGSVAQLLKAARTANPGNEQLARLNFDGPATASVPATQPALQRHLSTEKTMDFRDRQIHLSHKRGLILLVQDALNTNNETAQKVFDGLFEDDVTYQELPNLKDRTLARAIDRHLGAGHNIKETRIDNLLDAIQGATPDRRYCETCGRFDLDQKGGRWFVLDRDTCPKDDGIFQRVAFPTPFRAWTDHRMYEPETEKDAQRLPIKDGPLRRYISDEGGAVGKWLDTALTATKGALSLVDFADYLLWQSRNFGDPTSMAAKVDVIKALTDPRSFALDETGVRIEVNRALQFRGTQMADVQEGTRVEQQPVGPAHTGVVTSKILRETLARLYPSSGDARRLANDVGLPQGRVDFNGKALSFWFEVLEEAEKLHLLQRLVELAYEQYPLDPVLRAYLKSGRT